MFLCDIGNTSYHFLKDGVDFKKKVNHFNPAEITQKVYYICVNKKIKTLLKNLENWVDISTFINTQNYYATMGIDRIVASLSIKDGVVIDAGSAITVDVIKNNIHQGGFIYPGINAMNTTYKNISQALSYPFNFKLDLSKLPKKVQNAISYGYLKTLYNEVVSCDIDIILTGGDAKNFLNIFKDAKIDNHLIFKGMKKLLKGIDNG